MDNQAAAEHLYDEQHRDVQYSDGDLVWLWVPIPKPGLSGKLICRYVRPYRVVGCVSPVTYKVEPLALPD